MPIALTAAAVNLGVALGCGAVIGSERQVRQRLAGLRTNALVALGAAAFVVFSQLVPNEVSPTRVAAQVVSGIGFLGAGIIFRDGFNIHGLNTAATLWCSASVGLIAGIGAWDFALMMTALVVFVNLGLRPLVKMLKRHTRAGIPLARSYRIRLQLRPGSEEQARFQVIPLLARHGIHLLDAELSGTEMTLTGQLDERSAAQSLQSSIQELLVLPFIRQAAWEAQDDH